MVVVLRGGRLLVAAACGEEPSRREAAGADEEVPSVGTGDRLLHFVRGQGSVGIGHLTAPSAGGLAIVVGSNGWGNATLPAAAGSLARLVGMAINSGMFAASNAPTARSVARCWVSTPITVAKIVFDVVSPSRLRFFR